MVTAVPVEQQNIVHLSERQRQADRGLGLHALPRGPARAWDLIGRTPQDEWRWEANYRRRSGAWHGGTGGTYLIFADAAVFSP
jgi:hypothetical protein